MMHSERITFLYPDSKISPHCVHRKWAESLCTDFTKTPMGFGKFDISQIGEANVLLIESLYCLPSAVKYKKRHPNCKIISMVADTSFWDKRLSIARKIFYKLYLKYVDGYLPESERIMKDIVAYTKKPAVVVRPFLVNRYDIKRNGFNKNILFIGNDAKEKGYRKLIDSMKLLPDFELYLVGNCYKDIDSSKLASNIHVEGRVPDIKRYFEICSFYVLPADFEPFGVAPLEAMYTGMITLITKNVGLSETFDDDMKTLILDDNDPQTIANAIRKLSSLSSKDAEKLSKTCMDFARRDTENDNIKTFGEKFFRLLEKISSPA